VKVANQEASVASKEVIVTGGDANFFPFLLSALESLRGDPATAEKDCGVIDQGLTPAQREELTALGCKVVAPEWTLPVPIERRELRSIGLVARTALRDYFPGYQVYLWFDADAWMQTPDFLPAFVDGARAYGAAVALENGTGYRRSLRDLRWWCGNMVASYGFAGIRLALETSINVGVLCLTDTAPHWDAWKRAYCTALARQGKVNLDQHAFLAAIYLDQLPTALLPARFDWLPHLSCPVWNPETGLLCDPAPPYEPLSVVHLAGPDKGRFYRVPVLGGGALTTALTYEVMHRHAASGPWPSLLAAS
jgi:hypothetical protein